MKKSALFIVSLLFIGIASSNAQTSKAYFGNNSKQKPDENTIVFTFLVDNIANETQMQKLENTFKGCRGITSVKSGMKSAEHKASYIVTMPKKEHNQILQAMLLKGGINTVNIDGKEVQTVELLKYIESQKTKK